MIYNDMSNKSNGNKDFHNSCGTHDMVDFRAPYRAPDIRNIIHMIMHILYR